MVGYKGGEIMPGRNPYYDPRETDDLLRQADAVLEDDLDPTWDEDFDEDEDTMVYQNYSNRYGQDVRNFQNGYGRNAPPPQRNAPPQKAPFKAYNADFAAQSNQRHTPRPRPAEQPRQSSMARSYARENRNQPVPKQPRRMGCLVPLLLIVALLLGCWFLLVRPPKSEQSIGKRKFDTTSILLCGTDADGMRTDTMMMLYISGSERKVNLVSLPRDTYTLTTAGNGAKLNSAYGRNGTGEQGMEEGLLEYVKDIIGYRPDGYMLIDFKFIVELVDLMGGVEVDVPMDMAWETPEIGFSFAVEKGLQTLNGNDVLGVLRYRHGYYNQDLGRVEMQRKVVKACMKQWLKPSSVLKLGKVLKLFKDRSLTNLSTSNCMWIALRVLAIGTDDIATETLPGYPTMIGDQSCYVLYPSEVADMINELANPYKVTISVDDLNIAG